MSPRAKSPALLDEIHMLRTARDDMRRFREAAGKPQVWTGWRHGVEVEVIVEREIAGCVHFRREEHGEVFRQSVPAFRKRYHPKKIEASE